MSNNQPADLSPFRRGLIMLTLILSGEAIFLLPFVLVRIFRPTVLDVFELTNFQLGMAFSVYGIVAMIAYVIGGPLADLFSARKLMSMAMVATAMGGIVFGTAPSLDVLVVLYGFWGLTTILLFWAALIRVTREWGGQTSQGRAYGLLDGGRGLTAALISSISVAIFAAMLPVEVAEASLAQREAALAQVIWVFTGFLLVIAVLVWFVVPENKNTSRIISPEKSPLAGAQKVVKMPAVWLQAIIVVCAYVGYKGTDDFSLYARDVFGYDDVAAAQIATISFWIRPIAAVGAGFLSDRLRASTAIIGSFSILAIGSTVFASGILQAGMYWMLLLTVAGTSIGIYALRGIYFALFQEAKVPLAVTGSAVGLVSVIGYTPDVFFGPLMGYLLDRSPGPLGHQHVFMVLAGFAILGLITTLLFRRVTRNQHV